MTRRSENKETIEELFIRIENEFGAMAPKIIDVLVETLGGLRVTFPDIRVVKRKERDLKIRKEFNGQNYEALAGRFGLKKRMIRIIVSR